MSPLHPDDIRTNPRVRRQTKCANCGARMRASRLRVCVDCRIAGGYGAGLAFLLDVLVRLAGWWL
jgi:hypothetical protein